MSFLTAHDIEMDLDFDPFKEQMWHHKFDPHSVEPIPLAELKQEGVKQVKSESVQDFLNKSSIQSKLVQQALERSVIQERKEQDEDKDLVKLKALSAKTGLSIDTLRLLKAKESAIM